MNLAAELGRVVDPARVLTRSIDRLAFANDASVYRQVPRAVVLPRTVDEVRVLLRASRRLGLPLTFRAAGTSLSGQAVTDGILVVLSRHWRGVEVLDGGRRVRVQPGIVGGLVNRHLAAHGAKIGPDPASINACMMGGILANNSSGMCCGVEQNAYHTLDSMRMLLPDGLELDSAAADADTRLRRESPRVHAGLLELRRRLLADESLVQRVRRKYRLKNTMGYSLNALLDYQRPSDMLAHLMIGSEGTLGFIAEAVLHTVPDYPHKYTGLLFFADVPSACAGIGALRESGARALELMDRPSLRAIEREPGVPACIRELPPGAAALLIEYQCGSVAELEAQIADCGQLLPSLAQYAPAMLTREAAGQAALWRVRKGLIPSVGAMRARGTSFIIEDVVFPPQRLAQGVAELQALFLEYGYRDAIVFGHAKDGNLHFVLTQSFERGADVDRYDGFMHALAGLVADRHGGALNAEHGTGRNMAPFVAREWGDTAYALMCELKTLLDPGGLLNPGVVINPDPRAHVSDLKALPEVEAEVDPCIECGFCERHCPSRDLTLTPRQRIVVRREMARLRSLDAGSPQLRELERDYAYAALDTCATDGLCALACPVAIDTGRLVKRLRRQRHSPAAHELARLLARRFGLVESAVGAGLRLGGWLDRWIGGDAMTHLSRAASAASRGLLPRWDPALSRRASRRRDDGEGARASANGPAPAAIYFPSCVNRVLHPADEHGVPTSDALLRVAARAGVSLRRAARPHGICCGMPFGSKGFDGAQAVATGEALQRLAEWSDDGALPVVTDSSPCALTLKQAAEEWASRGGPRLRVLDGIELAHDLLLPRLDPRPMPGEVALHPVCSVQRMGLVEPLERLAGACAESVITPVAAGCCGFAGDRGLSHPELTAAALAPAAEELASRTLSGCYSSSPTCEIGLSRATGRSYRSFWHLLDAATDHGARARKGRAD